MKMKRGYAGKWDPKGKFSQEIRTHAAVQAAAVQIAKGKKK